MHADHLVLMPRVLPVQDERRKLPGEMGRCVPDLHLVAVGDRDVPPVRGESDRGDGAFERDVVEDRALAEMGEEGATICGVRFSDL